MRAVVVCVFGEVHLASQDAATDSDGSVVCMRSDDVRRKTGACKNKSEKMRILRAVFNVRNFFPSFGNLGSKVWNLHAVIF